MKKRNHSDENKLIEIENESEFEPGLENFKQEVESNRNNKKLKIEHNDNGRTKDNKSKPKSKPKGKSKVKKILLKSDLLEIAKIRWNSNKLEIKTFKSKKINDLRILMGPISDEEVEKLEHSKQISSSKLLDIDNKLSKTDLKKTLMMAGLGKGSSLSKNEMLQLVQDKKLNIYRPMIMDPDQSELLTRTDDPLLLVTAGPGSGKTTTLAKFACSINEKYPLAVVVILMFNRAAEDSCIQRIEVHGGKVKKSSQNVHPWKLTPGIYCMTFNKFAWRILYPVDPSNSTCGDYKHYNKYANNKNHNIQHMDDDHDLDEMESNSDDHKTNNHGVLELDKQIPEATLVVQSNPILNIDYLLIDEAQDIQAKLEDFTKALAFYAKHVMYLGDPRQEVISGAQFFSTMWNRATEEQKFILHYNHRSHPQIVEVLNAYSRHSFKTLHHDQKILIPQKKKNIPTTVKRQTNSIINIKDAFTAAAACTPKKRLKNNFLNINHGEEEKLEKLEKFLDEDEQDQQDQKDQKEILERDDATREKCGVEIVTCKKQNLAGCIVNELMKYPPNKCYIITPITVKKYKFEQLYMNVKNGLVQANCLYPLIVLSDEKLKYKPGDNVYYCGNSKKLKGTEVDYVILVGCEIPYTSININEADFLKSIFVCISRGIKKVIIIVPNSPAIEINSPMYQIMRFDNTSSYTYTTDPPAIRPKTALTILKVKDDISSISAISVKGISKVYVPPQNKFLQLLSSGDSETLRVKNNEDFVGMYIEALLAIKLGADVTKWTSILTHPETHFKILDHKSTKIADAEGSFLQVNELSGNYILTMRANNSNSRTNRTNKNKNGSIDDKQNDDKLCYDYLREMQNLMTIDLAYVLCVLNYTSQIGSWWIVSRPVFDIAQTMRKELSNLIDSIPPYLGLNFNDNENANKNKSEILKETAKKREILWGFSINHPILCDRSIKIGGEIRGVMDLMIIDHITKKQIILEIKYAQHKDSHQRQTGIYSALRIQQQREYEYKAKQKQMRAQPQVQLLSLNVKTETGMENNIKEIHQYNYSNYSIETKLINLLEGKTWIIDPIDISFLNNWTRATLAIRNGKNNRLGKRILIPGITGAILVALDVETTSIPITTSPLLEVGGAAWYFGCDTMETVFSELIDGISINKDDNNIDSDKRCKTSDIHGIYPSDCSYMDESQTKLKNLSQQWYESIHGRKIIVSWGSCDDFTAAGLSRDNNDHKNDQSITSIDLQKLYKQFLILNDVERRTNTKLCDAIDHLYPSYSLLLQYHRAFDDVVGTILIANAILDFGNIV